MWSTCLCWQEPVVKDNPKSDLRGKEGFSNGTHTASRTSHTRQHNDDGLEYPRTPDSGRPCSTTSAFQAVCKTYERGTFNLGRTPPSQQPPQAPAVPKTPSPRQTRASNASCSSEQATNSSQSSSSRSDGTISATSSRVRSEVSTAGRPQTVDELQELLTASPPRPLKHAPSPHVPDKQGNSRTNGNQHSDRKGSHNNTGEEGRTGWLRRANNSSMGNPVRQVNMERRFSLEIEDMDDPLDGNQNYHIIQPLNPGSSGSVYRCMDVRTNDEVAIKMVSRGVSNAKAAEREIANLRLCALHPYIIHMREVFLTRSHLAIVFEYAAGGNLAHYIETFQSSKTGRGISEERTRWIFQQIVVAVDYCHKMGIANRDIKLENVLLVPASASDPTKPPIVKLCDFGFSKDENADSICKTACGTPECVAPEVLTGELYDGKSSDIWSMGVLFFAMLTGTFPFSRPSDDLLDNTASLRKLFHRIAHAQYPKPTHLSKSALNLMDKMLQPNPESRIDIAGILSHEWFGRSLQSVALSVNKGLLEMPDSMLTGFAVQDEKDIQALLQSACHRTSSGLL